MEQIIQLKSLNHRRLLNLRHRPTCLTMQYILLRHFLPHNNFQLGNGEKLEGLSSNGKKIKFHERTY